MAIDWQVVGQMCGSMAGFAVIGKWLVKSVEHTNSTLPVIAETLKTVNEGMKELFDSRNNHEKRLERVETTHDIRGCNRPIQDRE